MDHATQRYSQLEMKMVHKAWKNVSAQAIANCFKTCHFIKKKRSINEEDQIQCKKADDTFFLGSLSNTFGVLCII